MENFENENLEQTAAQPEPQSAPQSEPQAEPQSAPQFQPQPEPQPQPQWQGYWQPPQTGFYHGAGVGQKEMPYTNGPYGAYQPYHQPWQSWQQPAQPQPQQPQSAAEPKPKKERKGPKIFRTILSAMLILTLVAVSCGFTASYCNRYWQAQNELLKQNLNDRLNALQNQIDDKQVIIESNGSLNQPAESLTATQIYQQNVNSVVAITCTVRTSDRGQIYESTSSGTGFIITESGYIVTNHHVIEGATKIVITMADGTEYGAILVGSNDTNDIALIKANATGFDPVTLGSSAAVRVGDQVIAIGNALGELSSTLTVGYVSGMDRDVTTDGTVINMIQTDAAINSGNSGGPLFNAKGEVIGITTAKYSGTTSSGASIEGISFAIPLDDVMDMIEDLRDYGYIKSAYLGVMVWEVDATVAATYNLPQGVYVEEVTPGFCAEKAGIKSKDIIIQLGGYTVKTMNDLSRALRAYEAGETVTVVVWRSGQEVILTITLDEKPAT